MPDSSAHAAPIDALVAWLRERHGAIMALEEQAHTALRRDENVPAYRELMLDRAKHIAALDADASPLLAPLPEDIREEISLALLRFATGARTALRLNSVFYMSALLYPDDHREGDPDNLGLLLAGLEAR